MKRNYCGNEKKVPLFSPSMFVHAPGIGWHGNFGKGFGRMIPPVGDF